MLLITCPFCGPRSESEFAYGGPKVAPRPAAPQDVSDQDWVQHMTHVPNPMGPVEERWWHVRGCGSRLVLTRDTGTHDILGAPEISS